MAARSDGISFDLPCPRCGYNLRGLPDPRCPECAFDVGPLEKRSEIPWGRRRELGRWRAYWRTVRLVRRENVRFCGEMAREVDYGASQRFRSVTIWIAFCAIMAAAGVLWLADANSYAWLDDYAWLAFPLILGTWLTLCAVTGVIGGYFQPQHVPVATRNRAAGLANYCCAPLAWTVWLPVSGTAVAVLSGEARAAFVVVGIHFAIVSLVTWWCTFRVARRVFGRRRAIATALLLPVSWFMCGALLLVGFSAAVAYVVLAVYSLSWLR